MFRNKPLSLAFLVSLSMHLSILFFVTIVVLPANFRVVKPSTISFLGPILEKTAFELMLEQKIRSRHVPYVQPMDFDNNFLLRDEKILGQLKSEKLFLEGKKDETQINLEDLFEDFKVTPAFRETEVGIPKEKAAAQQQFSDQEQEVSFIEGPFAKEEILFKPELPVIPSRVDQNQESFVVELKFGVLPSGSVDEVTLLASSGYPDIDMSAIKYIRGFKFLPLNSLTAPEHSLGRVRIKLKSK